MKEKFFFRSSKGHRLCGILSVPGKEKNIPVVVTAHGWTSGKDKKTYLRLEKALAEKDIAIFRFDFYGLGESEGKLEKMTLTEGVDNVISAIKFIKSKGYKKIGIFGSSFGGFCSIIAAARTKPFAMALKSPVSDYKKIPLEEERNPNFLEPINTAYQAAKKIKCPVLLVHGDADDIVPVEQSRKLAKMLKNCTYMEMKGLTHDYDDKQLAKMTSNAAGFFAKATVWHNL